jgi:ribosome-binding factor A
MSRRTERVQSLIRHELGEILQQEVKDPRIEGLVSITAVEVSPDLRRARVYLSVFSGPPEAEQHALEALGSVKAFMRRELGRRLRLRYSPELDLHIDHSFGHADEINRILKNLPPAAVED